jgi:hypothetical protein
MAHHGTAGSYDQSKLVKIAGIVKEFRFRNPHCALIVVGKDAAGKEVTYSFEVGSPGALVGRGLSRNTFKVGDIIALEMHPAWTNPNSGQPVGRSIVVNGKSVDGIAESLQL